MRWLGTKNRGLLLLGIWLIVTGLQPFVHNTFANMGSIMAILAVAAGVMILLDR